MKNNQIIDIEHILLKHYVTDKDIVVDMTMGNGFDTLFLALISKFVYAFDIQKNAVEQTKKRLDLAKLYNYELILDSHENILHFVRDFKYVVYNLGYLPKGDKSITTKRESTLNSLTIVLKEIKDNGMVFIAVYPGHDAGKDESVALDEYLATLDPNTFKIVNTHLPYQDNNPPYLITIYKKELK